MIFFYFNLLESFYFNQRIIVQELAIKKRHQAYRIAAIVHIARLKPKSWFFESQSLTRGGLA